MQQAPDLSLYYFATCPYCDRVLGALSRLGVEVELRDIHADPRWSQELVERLGRKTVPVLRIEGDEGDEAARYLPESADIVRYLTDRFAGGQGLPASSPELERLLLAGAVLGAVMGLADPSSRETAWGLGLIALAASRGWRAWRWSRTGSMALWAAVAAAGVALMA